MQELNPINPIAMLKPGRKPTGMSAVLLAFADDHGAVAWPEFRAHLEKTHSAGLIPAVNMDTGFASLIDAETRLRVLKEAQAVAAGRPFVAGAFVGDRPGAALDLNAYRRAIEQVVDFDAMPIIFQSHGLISCDAESVIDAYRSFADDCDRFLAFELGKQFAPFGMIYGLPTFHEIMKIPQCVGIKHSSLDRELEWRRLAIRDRERPGFLILTGNDLGIDMIMYGSDYLLGLSTFAPDAFALRDALWEKGDANFYKVNDLLQYLGALSFREPVPAYKHSAAQFLRLRGWLSNDHTHPLGLRRPASDREILGMIACRLHGLVASGGVD